jgi:hypothetical protein
MELENFPNIDLGGRILTEIQKQLNVDINFRLIKMSIYTEKGVVKDFHNLRSSKA